MKKFANQQGYKHKFVTPVWPRANGMVERFNRGMKEAVQTARLDGKNCKDAAMDYVAMYRATPHSATKVSPFASMHRGREMRTKLPLPNPRQPDDTIDRDQYERYRHKMTVKNKGEHRLQVGDQVLVAQKKRNKFTPAFDPQAYLVVGVKGSMVTARRGNQVITRNASMFKRVRSEEQDTKGTRGKEDRMVEEEKISRQYAEEESVSESTDEEDEEEVYVQEGEEGDYEADSEDGEGAAEAREGEGAEDDEEENEDEGAGEEIEVRDADRDVRRNERGREANTIPRRSGRERRQPARLEDYVLDAEERRGRRRRRGATDQNDQDGET